MLAVVVEEVSAGGGVVSLVMAEMNANKRRKWENPKFSPQLMIIKSRELRCRLAARQLPCARSAIAGDAARRGAQLVFVLFVHFVLFGSPRLTTTGRGPWAEVPRLLDTPNSGSVSTGHRIYLRIDSP